MSKNALATAETLLRWRDELVMSGWNGQSGPSFSSRLNDALFPEALVEACLAHQKKDQVAAAVVYYPAITSFGPDIPALASRLILDDFDLRPVSEAIVTKVGFAQESVSLQESYELGYVELVREGDLSRSTYVTVELRTGTATVNGPAVRSPVFAPAISHVDVARA